MMKAVKELLIKKNNLGAADWTAKELLIKSIQEQLMGQLRSSW
jgi:hypothetical protein